MDVRHGRDTTQHCAQCCTSMLATSNRIAPGPEQQNLEPWWAWPPVPAGGFALHIGSGGANSYLCSQRTTCKLQLPRQIMALPLGPVQAQRAAQDSRHLCSDHSIHAPGCRHSTQPLGPGTLHSRPSALWSSRLPQRHPHRRGVLARESYQPEPEPAAPPSVFERRGERDVYRC